MIIFKEIALYPIFGKPLIMYGGLTTLTMFILTATIAILNKRGIKFMSFKWHKRMAIISLIAGVMHGLLGVLSNIE